MAKILVVDDEPSNRLLAATILQYGGHEVIEAESASQALDRLAGDPDLVLVDLFLPEMSGAELISRIRKRDRCGVSIVLYTASMIDGATRDFMEMNDVRFVIQKPSEPGEVLATIDAALRRT